MIARVLSSGAASVGVVSRSVLITRFKIDSLRLLSDNGAPRANMKTLSTYTLCASRIMRKVLQNKTTRAAKH